MKVGDFGGMLKTSSLHLLWKEFDITQESYHHEKSQSRTVLTMTPRYVQNSNLVNLSLIGNFDIWEDFGMFVIEG